MGFNVKNEETHRLARELAALTGESMTAAITLAIRERLERVRGATRGSLAERLRSIGKRTAPRLKGIRSTDHDTLLYDERGLPR